MNGSENQQHWEIFSQRDPLFYIATDAANEKHFWHQGEKNYADYLVPLIERYKIACVSALDFGCGIGRYTFPFAKHCDNVVGVDISPGMIERAQKIANEKNIQNVCFILAQDFFTLQEKFDFIYCTNVFQHIENFEDIEKNISQMAHVCGDCAYLHFDTRSRGIFYSLKNVLPDFLLPRSLRRGIRRIRRSAEQVRGALIQAGFHIVEEHHPDSEYHYFLVRVLPRLTHSATLPLL